MTDDTMSYELIGRLAARDQVKRLSKRYKGGEDAAMRMVELRAKVAHWKDQIAAARDEMQAIRDGMWTCEAIEGEHYYCGTENSREDTQSSGR